MALNVLVIGATGSIGRHVVDKALSTGHATRALVRDRRRAESMLPDGVEIVEGDGNDPAAVRLAVEGVDAVIFTHGSHGGQGEAERIDYGIVHNTLQVLRDRRDVKISLMTSIGVTVHDGDYNLSTRSHDWKRRSERLVRRSGHPYTIVRPAWFDYNSPQERSIVFLQGDTRRNQSPADGVIARDEIARVLVDALVIPEANRMTLELVAEQGEEQADLTPLFAALQPDAQGGYEGALDPDTLPLDKEPSGVRSDLEAIVSH